MMKANRWELLSPLPNPLGRSPRRNRILAGLCLLAWISAGVMPTSAADSKTTAAAATPATQVGIQVRSFLPEKPLSRARRVSPIAAVIANADGPDANVTAKLILPSGVRAMGSPASQTARIEGGGEVKLVWQVEADAAGPVELRLEVSTGSKIVATTSLAMQFLPALAQSKPAYIPEPVPVRTSLLIGAHHCPLWEVDKTNLWANVRKHPERTPALGFYAQENPEVSDWETKWAAEHGVNFFIYCWYRSSQGGPVTMRYGSAIHDALFKSRFAGKMKFTIMWENQSRGVAGVADERDLMTNLLPFWITNYFQHPGYLKVDNRPLLFIYRPEFLVKDLGGVAQVKQAFERMRQACREAGFAGLYLLGEYRGLDPKHLMQMRDLGLDYTFAYCWGIPHNPTPAQSIETQMQNLKKTQELGILPQVATVSQAWSGWRDEGSIWKIPPRDFETLLRRARDFAATLPAGELGSRMLLLDNWNEWGEGHYIAPYREYGFGYLDAVRKVFASAPEPHVDLIPEDIGRGPYDTAYWSQMRRAEEEQKLIAKRVHKTGAPEDGLIGWWAFDEPADAPFAFDYAGNRLGGKLLAATREKGLDGNALDCQGGCVVIHNNRLFSPTNALTIECWVKTGMAKQANNWLVNRVLADGTATGYRLGIVGGKPCFEVPVTDWSHHLQSSTPLPTGRWVHLAGTYDGHIMTIYVDGEPRGTMDRPGPIKPNQFDLCLGSYTPNHQAHFTGLLDEVRLYSRALSADEVRMHYQKLAGRIGMNK